jgi:hypothetical protein
MRRTATTDPLDYAYQKATEERRSKDPMGVKAAIRELRWYFRNKARHPPDCICGCCEAVEVLALVAAQQRGKERKV